MLKMMGVCVGRIAAGRPVRRLPLMPVEGLLGPGAQLLPWQWRDASGCRECMGGIIHHLADVGFYRQGWSGTPEGVGMSPLRESGCLHLDVTSSRHE